MGIFSKIRRRVKKLIPREVRPFVPYLAAAIPGLAGASGFLANQGITSALARKALVGGATRYLTDDEADLKDIGITAALAAAPAALDKFAGPTGPDPNTLKGMLQGGARTLADQGPLTTMGAQAGIDYGIKAAELNEEALDEYNRMLAQQGITDRKDRRAAIRAIYEGTGTWDMDEVDSMLDTYGYRTGGRVGYADGDMILTERSTVTPEQRMQIEGNQMAEDALIQIYNEFKQRFPEAEEGDIQQMMRNLIAEEQLEGVVGTEGLGILGIDRAMNMITPESVDESTRRIMMGDTQYGDIGSMKDMLIESEYEKRVKRALGYKDGGKTKKFEESDFYNSFKYAKEGLESLEEAEDEIKPLPIRELRLARGGDVDDDVMEFDEEIITPEYLMREEGVEIGPQVSEPSRADELNSLSMDLFGKPLGDLTEIQMEMLMNFASQQASGYSQEELDMYDQYKYDMNEQRPGMPIMSIDEYLQMELGAARMGVKKGGIIQLMPQGVIYKGKAKDYPGIKQLIKDAKKKGKRKGKADGGLMNLGGNEMDLRGGGFVPMGAKERADDVPARLSKNEFVMTADAVRGAGGGSVQKGADLMYDQMKRLEGQA